MGVGTVSHMQEGGGVDDSGGSEELFLYCVLCRDILDIQMELQELGENRR